MLGSILRCHIIILYLKCEFLKVLKLFNIKFFKFKQLTSIVRIFSVLKNYKKIKIVILHPLISNTNQWNYEYNFLCIKGVHHPFLLENFMCVCSHSLVWVLFFFIFMRTRFYIVWFNRFKFNSDLIESNFNVITPISL